MAKNKNCEKPILREINSKTYIGRNLTARTLAQYGKTRPLPVEVNSKKIAGSAENEANVMDREDRQ